ncbi:hypothetical protein CWATWH0005_77 [Crocosphaera watsonii WH 0005]|uniref:Uncharacterized protein n=1 Tax=Crocosphaera watsonii WH 0005 TaxID=423472 RepID=T2ITR2_CROWT|nr:hypothetical protein CWATWH0005_77 [Crocosphaera watsonii WH 0005]
MIWVCDQCFTRSKVNEISNPATALSINGQNPVALYCKIL